MNTVLPTPFDTFRYRTFFEESDGSRLNSVSSLTLVGYTFTGKSNFSPSFFLRGTFFHSSGLDNFTIPSGDTEPESVTPSPSIFSGGICAFAASPCTLISIAFMTFSTEQLPSSGILTESVSFGSKSNSPTSMFVGFISTAAMYAPFVFMLMMTGFGPLFLCLPGISLMSPFSRSLPTI